MNDVIVKMASPMVYEKFDGESGSLEAMVTTFGNADSVGDVMAPEALDKFIKNFNEGNKQLPMLWNHDRGEVIGVWTKFDANSRGVKGTGEIFTDVSRGNDVRNLIKRGAVGSVSIGFRSNKFETLEQGGRLFKEIELVETSVVLTPANSKAVITQIKTDEGKVSVRKLEKLLCDAGLSRSESKSLIHGGASELRDAIESELKKDDFLQQLKLKLGDTL